MRPSRILFVQKEGLFAEPSEGGVEYVRLPSVGASGDTSGELLSGKSEWRPMPHSIGVGSWSRDALQKYQRASLVGPEAVRLAPRARRLPTVGSHFENSLLGLRHDLGHPERSLARATAMYGLAHSCP